MKRSASVLGVLLAAVACGGGDFAAEDYEAAAVVAVQDAQAAKFNDAARAQPYIDGHDWSAECLRDGDARLECVVTAAGSGGQGEESYTYGVRALVDGDRVLWQGAGARYTSVF